MADIALKPDKRVPDTIGVTIPPEKVLEQRAYGKVANGKLRLRQVRWCDALVSDWFLMSQNALCRKYHTDPSTVRAVVKAYDDQGKLPEARTRSLHSIERLMELSSDCLREHFENKTVSARDASILLGIAHDKYAQLLAGVIPGTEGKTQVEVDANAAKAVLDVFERLKALKAAPAALPPAALPPTDVPQLPQTGGEGVSHCGSA